MRRTTSSVRAEFFNAVPEMVRAGCVCEQFLARGELILRSEQNFLTLCQK